MYNVSDKFGGVCKPPVVGPTNVVFMSAVIECCVACCLRDGGEQMVRFLWRFHHRLLSIVVFGKLSVISNEPGKSNGLHIVG